MAEPVLTLYREALVGLRVSHAWCGHGSAIFFEFGALTPKTRRDGSTANPTGEMGLMLDCDWRVESADSIVCGSGCAVDILKSTLEYLIGASVVDLKIYGRLREIAIELSNGHYVASFTTEEGDPEWTLFDRRSKTGKCLGVKNGTLLVEPCDKTTP